MPGGTLSAMSRSSTNKRSIGHGWTPPRSKFSHDVRRCLRRKLAGVDLHGALSAQRTRSITTRRAVLPIVDRRDPDESRAGGTRRYGQQSAHLPCRVQSDSMGGAAALTGAHEEPTGVMSLSPKPADANTVPAEPPSANAPTADWYGNRNGADGGFRPAGASPTEAQSRRNQE